MRVHSCTVDDGRGDQFDVLDALGCTRDKFVYANVE